MKILKFPFLSLSVFFGLGILSLPVVAEFYSLRFLLPLSFIGLLLAGPHSYVSVAFRMLYAACYMLLFFALGTATAYVHTVSNQKKHYTQRVSAGEKHFLKIAIRESLKPTAYADRYIAEVLFVEERASLGRILVVVPKGEQGGTFQAGQHLSVYQSISAIDRPLNPHQFDYQAYLQQRGIYGQLRLASEGYKREEVVVDAAAWLEGFRQRLIGSFEKHQFTPEVAAVVASLLFGQRQGISADLKSRFAAVGVVHVLAISGLHIGIIYIFLVWLLKRLRLGTVAIYVMATVVLWLYALTAGFAAPVVRAVSMFTLMAVASCGKRHSSTYNNLAIAFFAMLCVRPFYIVDAGFQLSFAAVFAIVFFHPIIRRFCTSKWGLWRYVKEIVGVSLAVQIGILPLTIYYFHSIPVFFLLGNLLVIPLVTLILVSLLVLLALNFAWPGAALLLGKGVNLLIAFMNAVVRGLSEWSVYPVENLYLNAFLAVCAAVVLLVVGFAVKARQRRLVLPAMLAVWLFQLLYVGFAVSEANKSEVLLLYHRQQTVLLFKRQQRISVYADDARVLKAGALTDYKNHAIFRQLEYCPLPKLLTVNNQRLLLIDSLGGYQTAAKADILLFSGNSRLHFGRVIAYHQPDLVLAAATFPPWEVRRLQQWCNQKKIPFHSVSEKGFYRF
ncbi:ComEC/Rec2 family competence protein [Flavobacterium sp. JP2137]|uniref:ComEC/Rec2 family competence protein n=1 Tax=Flavobacterium sp. JP2137 TaxID=3414510 RepID=UPI003D2FC5F2